MLKKWFCVMAVSGVFAVSGVARAQEEAAAPAEGTVPAEEGKLVKVTTLEQAFVRALQTRQQLGNRVVALVNAMRQEQDAEKKETIKAEVEKANRALQGVKVAMEVIFGIGNRREYEYVANTVYLKVGTVEETFARAVRTREALKQFIAQKTKEKEEAADAETVQKLEKEIEEATRRYQVVVASLQIVFGVVPQRNYTYNPQNATLYLNVTDAEVEELKAKIEEIRKKQEEAAADKSAE